MKIMKITADDKNVQNNLRLLAERMQNPTPVMKEIGEIILTSVGANWRLKAVLKSGWPQRKKAGRR